LSFKSRRRETVLKDGPPGKFSEKVLLF
jgi:hypothetical protein